MKKLVMLGAGVLAAGSAAVISSAVAFSQPGGTYNVIGEPYAKALAILKSQGVSTGFGGSFGSVLPQAQCLVDTQKVTSGGKMLLSLDCSQAAADAIAAMGPAAGPRVGSNGITTIKATPVAPRPAPAAPPPPAG
ncbi:hypothetical protein ACN27E_03775 [Mycobacterium sp. WMMD1722]|uniref:hypothetical protein n=1 Tax=Mycobacterium sp. WMMD1722 TaxID=3404117 RepID=UPI003BF60DAB